MSRNSYSLENKLSKFLGNILIRPFEQYTLKFVKNVLKLIGRFLYQVMLNCTVLGYVDLSTSKMWNIGDKGIVSFHIIKSYR